MGTRVALLMNFVAPYRVPLLQAVSRGLDTFKIFISTPMEPDRLWIPDWTDLDVVVQSTVTIPMRRRLKGFSQQLFIHFPYDTIARLSRFDPDVVISGEFGLRSLQASLYRRWRRDSRLIIWATVSEHTEREWGGTRTALRRFILRAADGVIVNGASGGRYISSLGIPTPIFVMNQPVDVSRFASSSLDRSPEVARRLVYSGRLIAQKGVIELQQALAKRARLHPSVKIEMVWLGDGALRERLQSTAVPDNLDQTFLGHVPYDGLPPIYASCGALVLPSMFDEWGLVVNEAMASGLPVLGSVYSQAVEEMVLEGRTGWTFDPVRPETIDAALGKLFNTSDKDLALMRDAARSRAAIITPEAAAERMLGAISAVNSSMRADTSVVPAE